MKLRAAALLLVSVTGLLGIGVGLCFYLLSVGLHATRQVTEERLRAIGVTATYAVGLTAVGGEGPLLDSVARSNQLEAAYLLSGSASGLRPVEQPGRPTVSLLRMDPDRALRALNGELSIGAAYSLEPTDSSAGDDSTALVLAGYFPVPPESRPHTVLVLEAGAAFITAPKRLRGAAWAASAVAAVLAVLCVLLLLGALRAAARERRLYAQAERGQALRQLAAMIAHEIRNPLGTIRAGVELLCEGPPSPELVADILSEIERLGGLTSEFLTLAKDAALRIAETDVAALCEEVCERLRRQSGSGALDIKRTGAESAVISADADRVRQVLLNLALNAVEAMPDGGELELRVEPGRRGVSIFIRDSGPGITAQTSRRLFEPFQTTKAAGSGLGLVLSRRIAEKHGGSLEWLAQPPGESPRRGACFKLYLPATPPLAAQVDADSEGDKSEADSALR